jgi:FtsH-binding integral membrane protein
MLDEEIDLIALSRSADEDFVSRFLRDHWAFQKRATVDPLDQTTIYKGQHVVWTVATISMFCAIVLLVVAMMSLYVVNSPRAKLGMVAAYTVLFGVSLALLTNARRAEVYGAAAAYAAVLVVFISGSVGGFQNEQCLVQLPGGYFKAVSCPS